MLNGAVLISHAEDLGTVTFSVYEYVGNTYLLAERPVTLTAENNTPLKLLQQLSTELNIVFKGAYVSSINGFTEREHGVYSGWVYTVNGAIQDRAAADYTLKDGEKLQWRYAVTAEQAGMAAYTTTPTIPPTHPPVTTINQATKTTPTTTPTTTVTVPSTLFTTAPTTAPAPIIESYLDTMMGYVTPTILYLKNNPGSFTSFSIGLYNAKTPSKAKKALLEEAGKENLTVTDIERLIINLFYSNVNPDTYRNMNLTKKLFNRADIGKQGINATIYALIIYGGLKKKPENVMWNDTKLMQEVLDAQQTDGSFALGKDMAGDVDITALAVTALSRYQSNPNAKSAVDKAVLWLSSKQNKDGTFSGMSASNCESTACVITAISSLGISLDDKRFTKDKSITGGLLSFFKGNAFVHTIGGEHDGMASEQALIAIKASEMGTSPYVFDISTIVEEKPDHSGLFYLGLAIYLLSAAGIGYFIFRRIKR